MQFQGQLDLLNPTMDLVVRPMVTKTMVTYVSSETFAHSDYQVLIGPPNSSETENTPKLIGITEGNREHSSDNINAIGKMTSYRP